MLIAQRRLRIRLNVCTEIVIDAKKVDSLPRNLQIPGFDESLQLRKNTVRIATGEKRSQKGVAPQIFVPLSHECGRLRTVSRNSQIQVQSCPEFKRSVNRSERLKSRSLGEIQVVRGGEKRLWIGYSGGVDTQRMAQISEHRGLI